MRKLAFLAFTLLFSASSGVLGDSEGQKLVAEHRCETCHHNKTLGEAKAVYLRKDRKVTSMEKLRAQVARCNSELNLKLFPEDEEHIVAYLNATYYKFPAK